MPDQVRHDKLMRDFSQDHRWLSINTATVRKSRGQDLPLPQIIEACVKRGIRAISPWRDQVAAAGLPAISKLVKAHGLELSGYCRGGMFTAADAAGLKAARDDNRRAADEARELNAACLVLVVGALPGALAGKPAHKDIALSRSQVRDGIGQLLDYARTLKMPLAIEPLHPMYAADRACVNTMEHALDMCDELDPSKTGALGVAVDVYHVWWDPKLQAQIERAGRERLLAFHVCDWLTPTADLLNDRGMMGDGVIDIPRIRAWVEAQGLSGYSEVEIFSTGNWWQREAGDVLDTCIARHRSAV
jgi:sugar phosphate isomerase/epimerase